MFTKELKLATINGTDFEITWGWGLLAVLFIGSFSSTAQYDRYLAVLDVIFPAGVNPAFPGSNTGMILFAAALVIGVYTSVILHEIGHSLAAQHYGIHVNSIRLWIAGGVARIQTIPPHPRKEFVITIAGPLVTVALIPTYFTISVLCDLAGSATLSWLFMLLSLFNCGMLALNLTPAFPLDGGRLFRSTLARRFSYQASTQYAAYTTALIGLLVAGVSVFTFQPGYIFLAVLVGIMAWGEKSHVEKQYDHEGIICSGDEFLIYEQSFFIAPELTDETRRILTQHIKAHGGTVVSAMDSPDLAVVASDQTLRKAPDSLRASIDGVSPDLEETTVLPVEYLLDNLDLHGTTVQHVPRTTIQTRYHQLPAPIHPQD